MGFGTNFSVLRILSSSRRFACTRITILFFYFKSLRSEWIVIVRLMKFSRIFQLHFQDTTFAWFSWWFINPFESGIWEWLAHRPAVEIIGIVIHDVVMFFTWIITRQPRIISLGVSFSCHADAATHPFFYE